MIPPSSGSRSAAPCRAWGIALRASGMMFDNSGRKRMPSVVHGEARHSERPQQRRHDRATPLTIASTARRRSPASSCRRPSGLRCAQTVTMSACAVPRSINCTIAGATDAPKVLPASNAEFFRCLPARRRLRRRESASVASIRAPRGLHHRRCRRYRTGCSPASRRRRRTRPDSWLPARSVGRFAALIASSTRRIVPVAHSTER